MVKPQIDLPAHAMEKCPELYKATKGDFPTLFRNHIEVRGQAEECRLRHNTLVDRINEINKDIE